MITKIGANYTNYHRQINSNSAFSKNVNATNSINSSFTSTALIKPTQISTTLQKEDEQKYLYLLNLLKGVPQSENSPDLTPSKQMELLLKNGKLLSKSNHDNSSTLDNLYSIATTERACNLDKINLITSTLDILCNPRYVTQTFGDIPEEIQNEILENLPKDDEIKKDPQTMNVYTSGTCAAASIEVTMADKYPAEFSRWVSKLSSKDKSLELNVKLKSISKNPFEALDILNILQANKTKTSLDKVKVKVDLDEYAYTRAYTQEKHWNKGERNIADVLIQSAIMRLGSQRTYNTLTDTRKNNSNPQGLIEVEKTFVESLVKNKEITSLIYHQIDDDQNLIGYNCSLDKISKHITDTIDSGDNVILGYVLTNETAGITSNPQYNPQINGPKNRVINGHEITIVDYYKDEKNELVFICVDTDDDSPELVQYGANWLLPKIHHAGYPAYIVEADEKEIMKNLIA